MRIASFVFVMLCGASPMVSADVVSDWDQKACATVADAKLPTPLANRVLAIAQTAVYEAVNRITRKYPVSELQVAATAGASVDAAVAAANRATLTALVPAQTAAITGAYDQTIAAIPDGPAKTSGIAAGEAAAAAVLARRADDGAATVESYRPITTAGVYVPTTVPAVPQWPARKPWLMTSPSQFRPGPPPALTQ